MFVIGADGKDFYLFEKRAGDAGTSRWRLDRVGESYAERGWDGHLRPGGMQLRPNTAYRIGNASNGAAAVLEVVVQPAANCRVKAGSPTVCQ